MVVRVVISYKDRIGCFYQNKHFVRLIILSGRFSSSVVLYKHGLCIVGLYWTGGMGRVGVEAFSWSVWYLDTELE